MRKMILTTALIVTSTLSLAQLPEGIQRSSSPSGMKVQGDMSINAVGKNVNTVAVGQNNAAKNAIGAVRSNTNIQGKTRINAVGVNQNAVAVGKGNKAENTVGVIGAE
jgi:hypothetical protein